MGKVLTVLIVLSYAFLGLAATLSGIVTDTESQPLLARIRILNHRTATCITTYTDLSGRFQIDLDPGVYVVEVTKGPEYEIMNLQVEISQSEEKEIKISLRRLYNLEKLGWYGGDSHLHSLHSDGQQDVETVARACAANGLSWAVLTDHNTVDGTEEWYAASKFGLLTITGEEVTTKRGHFNALGIKKIVDWEVESKQDIKRILTDISKQSAISQVNHPFDMKNNFVDWDVEGYDVIEVWNGGSAPNLKGMGNLETKNFWFQLLNSGIRIHATANSDCHDVYSNLSVLAFLPTQIVLSVIEKEFKDIAMIEYVKQNEQLLRAWVGYGLHPGTPRTYVKVHDLTPTAVLTAIKNGNSFMTNGPLLLVDIEGKVPGETVNVSEQSSLVLNLRVFSNLPLEKLLVIQGGKTIREIDVTGLREYVSSIEINTFDGSWIVIEAYGSYPVYAVTNPIYLDFQPSK